MRPPINHFSPPKASRNPPSLLLSLPLRFLLANPPAGLSAFPGFLETGEVDGCRVWCVCEGFVGEKAACTAALVRPAAGLVAITRAVAVVAV